MVKRKSRFSIEENLMELVWELRYDIPEEALRITTNVAMKYRKLNERVTLDRNERLLKFQYLSVMGEIAALLSRIMCIKKR
jgi:hypothetical protein